MHFFSYALLQTQFKSREREMSASLMHNLQCDNRFHCHLHINTNAAFNLEANRESDWLLHRKKSCLQRVRYVQLRVHVFLVY